MAEVFVIRLGGAFPALGLDTAQFVHILIAAALQTRFVDVVIAELLFVGHVGLQQDHVVTNILRVVGEGFFELGMTVGVEGEFECLDAAQTPVGIDNGLNQLAFGLANGSEIVLKRREEGSVFFDIFAGKQDGAAGESESAGTLADIRNEAFAAV
jgi:hypothetical protein